MTWRKIRGGADFSSLKHSQFLPKLPIASHELSIIQLSKYRVSIGVNLKGRKKIRVAILGRWLEKEGRARSVAPRRQLANLYPYTYILCRYHQASLY